MRYTKHEDHADEVIAIFNKREPIGSLLNSLMWKSTTYIIPGIPPIPPPIPPISGIAGLSSCGNSATMASVVIINPAIDDAACSELRTTLTGSITPSLIRSTYSPVCAL